MSRERCPTPEVEAFGDLFRRPTLAEYAGKELQMFGLDCYKPEFQNDYYLQLRTSKGLHIVTIPNSGDCSKRENLIKQFYVTKNTKTQKHLFKMDQPDIEALIESCWNAQRNEKVKDIWFYYFLTKNTKQNVWKLQKQEDKDCPAIPKNDIKITKQMLSEGEANAEYSNGGNRRVKLSCHGGQSSDFATLTTSVSGQVLQIDKFNCLSEAQLYGRLYVDIDDFNLIVVGSRKTIDDAWCWYSFYLQGNMIEQDRTFYGYRPNTIVAQWYKEKSEGCRAVKSEQILINDNDLSLENKHFDSMYIVDVSECEGENYSCKQQEILYNYCYYMEKADGNRMYTMDIMNVKGRHLATLTDFDCSSFNLAENSYMFTMRESGYSEYLVLGTRTHGEDKWCQYDICVNCKKKEVRKNINTQIRRRRRGIYFLWEKANSLWCLAVKSENIFTNENEKGLDKKILKSVFAIQIFKSPMGWTARWNPMEDLLTYCYYEEGTRGKHMLVIRTVEGRHLVTIKDFDCSPEAPFILQERIYMFELTDSGNKYLALGTRTSFEDEWCRYDICLDCKTTILRRNSHRTREPIVIQWRLMVQVKNYLTLKDKSKEVVVKEKWDNTMKLVAKYKSGSFGLDCYQGSSSSNYKYTSVVLDLHGKQVAEIQEHDCSSVEGLREKLTIFIPKNAEKENYVDFLLIDISLTSLPNNYIVCTLNEQTSCRKGPKMYTTEETILKGKWVKVPTESCYSIPRENIFTVSTEVNLNGYKFLTTYINEDREDEDTFVLVCYQNYDLNEGGRIITHLKSLNGQHVIYIRNLDCSSKNTLSRVSYMSIMTAEENRYLVLGTRSTREEENGPWCRYDICISCLNKDIRVNAADDPGSLTTFKWSMAGIKLTTPAKNNCGGKEISSSTIVSRHANVNYLEFSVECHELSDHQAKDYCSVLKSREIPLVTFTRTLCTANYALNRNYYLYTLYKDSEFSLIRMDQTKDKLEKSTTKETIKEQWLYYSLRNKKTTDWIMVKNPKPSLMESIDFKISEEKTICLPQSKKMTDLKYPPVVPVKTRPQ